MGDMGTARFWKKLKFVKLKAEKIVNF